MLNHNEEATIKAKFAAEESAIRDELRQTYAGCNATIVTLTEPDPNTGVRRLGFDVANGAPIESKYINKVDGKWREIECADCRRPE
jgi:hypothetical protein